MILCVIIIFVFRVLAERKKAGESDAESVRTEEFERKYRDYLIHTQKNLLQNELEREKRVAAAALNAPKPPAAPRKYRGMNPKS